MNMQKKFKVIYQPIFALVISIKFIYILLMNLNFYAYLVLKIHYSIEIYRRGMHGLVIRIKLLVSHDATYRR